MNSPLANPLLSEELTLFVFMRKEKNFNTRIKAGYRHVKRFSAIEYDDFHCIIT